MTKADIHHQDKRLEKALEKRLPRFGGDREVVKSFLDQLLVEELSPARLNKYIVTSCWLLILRRQETLRKARGNLSLVSGAKGLFRNFYKDLLLNSK